MNETELLELFWDGFPDTIHKATELWLRVESGDPDALLELRRTLHSLKGEAQMLGLGMAAELTEYAERCVARIRLGTEWPPQTGNVILRGLEALNAMVPDALQERDRRELVDGAGLELDVLYGQLAKGGARATDPRSTTSTNPEAQELHDPTIALRRIEPLLSELRRLYSQQALLYPQLAEIRKMLRALLREFDPNAEPSRLAEAMVKTLGFGETIERRLTAAISEWSATEYLATTTLDQLESMVRDKAVVPRTKIETVVGRTARSAAQTLGKEVKVRVEGDTAIDGAIEQRLQPALLHLIRNAVDHGIEPPQEREQRGKPRMGSIRVRLVTSAGTLRIEVADDGRGLDFEAIRKKVAQTKPEASDYDDEQLAESLFRHGFSTRQQVTELSGRGVGLDVVREAVTAGGGDLRVESIPGEGTRFLISLPASTRLDTVMPVSAAGLRVAIPSSVVHAAARITNLELTPTGLATTIAGFAEEEPVPIRSLASVLGRPRDVRIGDVVLGLRTIRGSVALTVDGYSTPRALIAQPAAGPLVRTPVVQSIAPTPDGEVLLVLDVGSLYERAIQPEERPDSASQRSDEALHCLVVEDASVARELLSSMLRAFGLRVSDAIDGALGLDHALKEPPDLILTDLEMPVMDGFEMVERMRASPKLAEVPVVVLSTRNDEATRAWAERVNIWRFLPKRDFEEEKLRALIEELLQHRAVHH